MNHRPPSAARALWILARLLLRRRLNFLMSAGLMRRLSGRSGAGRTGTPTKSGGRFILGAVLAPILFLNGVILASACITNLSMAARGASEAAGKLVVTSFTYSQLCEVESAMHRLARDADSPESRKLKDLWNRYLDDLFADEVRMEFLSEDQERARLAEMRRVFERDGTAGFEAGPGISLTVAGDAWPRSAAAAGAFLNALGVILLLWVPTMICMSLGLNNKDLGQVERSFQWLFTFPVPARTLFASRMLSFAFLNPLVWGFLLPFAIMVYVGAGFALTAIAIGTIATLYLTLLTGALTCLIEVWLRRALSLKGLKNVQALFTIVGTLCFFLFYAITFSPRTIRSLVHALTSIPGSWIWNPFSAPLMLGMPGGSLIRTAFIAIEMLAILGGSIALTLAGTEWLTREGLVTAGSPYQSARGGRIERKPRSWMSGIPAVELRLLFRDRNLLVQVALFPLFLPASYLLTDARFLPAVLGNFHHAALAVFGVGAYSFLSSAILLMNREGHTLWQLLTFPHSLLSILMRKTSFWAAIGLVYGALFLAVVIALGTPLHPSSAGDAFLALYGIALYAFIASGLGILGTDVMETEPRGRVKVATVYLYMLLAAMYAKLFFTAGLWAKLAELILSSLFAFALWQKVRDICPYLLDPTDRPPRTIGLADGMIAALAFFVVQGLATMLMPGDFGASPGAQITVAYVFAGLSVGSVVLLVFWQQGIASLWESIGLVAFDARGVRRPARQGLIEGAIWGGAAALGAVLYFHVLGLFPQWQVWKQEAELNSFLAPASQPFWIWILVVCAAPVFEEFLFRGLVFQGLRRSTGPIVAIVASAALFALVHPPIAVIPVFGLGVAAAVSFNRSGLLLAPIVAHALYNGSLLLLNRV